MHLQMHGQLPQVVLGVINDEDCSLPCTSLRMTFLHCMECLLTCRLSTTSLGVSLKSSDLLLALGACADTV
jgi:hypothetical protein